MTPRSLAVLLAERRKLLDEAIPGPWVADREGMWCKGEAFGGRTGRLYPIEGIAGNRSFIAAHPPETLRALYDGLEVLAEAHERGCEPFILSGDEGTTYCAGCAALARLAERLGEGAV